MADTTARNPETKQGATNTLRQPATAVEQSPEQLANQIRGLVGYLNARCGRRAQALAEIQRLQAQASAGRYVSHYALAQILAGLGDKEQAFGELEKAYEERAWAMFSLKAEPAFDGLRDDPRFGRLLRKIGLSDSVPGGAPNP